MGVSLDTARFANIISKKLFVGTKFIHALVIGSHGETMLPMPSFTTVRSKELTSLLSPSEIADLVERTKKRGAEIVSLYGLGSAYYGPSASIYEIVHTILTSSQKEIPVCAVLEGEYGLIDVSIGVPAVIGSMGIKKIIELNLSPGEKEAFDKSAESIKDSIKALNI